VYAEETEKSFREIINSKDSYIRYNYADPEDKLMDHLADHGLPMTHEDFEYIEHRTYQDYVGTVDYDVNDPNHEEGSFDKQWIPYE
jgi:hypothetical protein